ncbi:Fe(3+)-hydroxamate ABC transporter permease FhuB [Paracoccus sp. NSM]|uniref:Fe(3+)-hydroxamate ABC transporter permease FhuB n=1 Tax=Paracoccus sp. NSM TaxID=3457784 RepID=UPI004035AE6A
MSRALPLVAVAVLLALWLPVLQAASWPAWPWHPEGMSLDQIMLAYGLLPRVAAGLLAGAILGLTGALLQIVLRNPVADPTTLGITAGAQLALVLATLLAPAMLESGRWPVAASGAAGAATLVTAIGAARSFHPVTMVIAGMLVALTASAVTAALVLSQGEYLLSLVIWNGGSLVQQDWSSARTLALVLGPSAVLAGLLLRPLVLLSLGGEVARGLGLNVGWLRLAAIALAVLLSAAVSAELGLIAFVGLAAPAMVRALGASDPGRLLALSPLAGALILSLADAAVLHGARLTGEMFPTGALTGLIGGPLLLWLLPRLRGAAPPGLETPAAATRRAQHPRRLLSALALVLVLGGAALVWVGRVPGGWVILDPAQAGQFLPLRLPRLIAAAAAGAALATAGAMLQRLTANPLASPEVLGVSGGAALGFALAVFALAAPGPLVLAGASMAGAALALALLLAFAAGRDLPPERVLLAGIAVSALASALLTAMMAVGDMRAFRVLAWLSGSSAHLGMADALAMAGVALGVLLAGLAMTRWLAILPLGGPVAIGLGLPVGRARLAVIGLAGLATGAATMLVGPLSFVGLMAPHLARRMGLLRPDDHLTGAALTGACLMLAADFGARMAGFPYDLPLGLFASLIGAPWLIWLMLRRA